MHTPPINPRACVPLVPWLWVIMNRGGRAHAVPKLLYGSEDFSTSDWTALA
ncbi:MAG: hypothetical protein AVDCRST_MAG64-2635 [uncultured Phycisphaerae bacterium]|uniref:Uncharacterized protein n=1 Tax=uncultured Phycisphaerae bacterium TaxID=904963 RepID=A0A6J4PIP2_9BACT|nr:MAG: hypothetical protein AVDCRST_MAG64-2635 [uncultured Phycisphaerae bacterium]